MLIRHIVNLSHLKSFKGQGRIESSYQLFIVRVRYGKGRGINVNFNKLILSMRIKYIMVFNIYAFYAYKWYVSKSYVYKCYVYKW